MSNTRDLESYFAMAGIAPKRIPSYVAAARELAKAMVAGGEARDERKAASQLIAVCGPQVGVRLDDFMRVARSFPPASQERS